MSSNPNNGLYWLAALACCWPVLCFLAGVLVASAFQRGWWIFKIDHTRAPRLGRRNA